MTMKSKLRFPAAAVCVFLASLTTALSQTVPPRAPAALPVAPPNFDPNTGLPMAPQPATPDWIDDNWKEPRLLVTNLVYDGIPLKDVVQNLRERFSGPDGFDILPLPEVGSDDSGSSVIIRLTLRNVRASEIFNAMNLIFENDRKPLRWFLKGGINRQLVQLRALPPPPPEAKAPDTQRMVYFVGNLIGDEKSGGMTMDQIIKTILDVWPSDFGKPDGVIRFHEDAQLLVINGTPDQIAFIRQTLAALGEKVQAARPKTEASKDIDELNNLIKSLKNLGNDTK
jgi:hypothetical protein